jgi:membrane protein insertase Oxa1/YidC/SpoIIIJ
METYQWLPLTGTLAAMLIVFMSSGTRDPSYYHPVEMVWIGLSVALLGAHAFLVQVQNLVASFYPWGTVVVFVVLLVATAILAR